MIRSFALLAALGLGLVASDQASAQTTGSRQARPRFFNPFLQRFSRVTTNPFGLPQLRGTNGTAVKPAVPTPIAAAATSVSTESSNLVTTAKVAKDDTAGGDSIAAPVVVRPPFRPPVRSPYRPPPRPPF